MAKVHVADQPPQIEKEKIDKETVGPIRRFFNRHLVGNSDSSEFSEKWRENFSHHPSWCDADMVQAGNATGNCTALYARSFFQRLLYHLGGFVQTHPNKVLVIGIFLFMLCCVGLKNVTIETDLVKLWVSQGGRLEDELSFLSRVKNDYYNSDHRNKREANPPPIVPVNVTVQHTPPAAQGSSLPEVPRENGLGGGFQVVIQTPETEGQNVLTREGLLKHVELMNEISQYTVEMYGENWTLADICFKPPPPNLPKNALLATVGRLLERIIPCIWITPIDCFWEGSKPLGPYPALDIGEDIGSLISSLPKGPISWKNLNPTAVIDEVNGFLDLRTIKNFFHRAGIGQAYLDRPCINPLDPECPTTAPNAFQRCQAYKRFDEWNKALPTNEQIVLEEEKQPPKPTSAGVNLINEILGLANGGKRRKREATVTPSTQTPTTKAIKDDDYYNYSDDSEYDSTNSGHKKSKDANEINCKKYGKSFLSWMDKHPDQWEKFLSQDLRPVYPNYGQTMTGGCLGFGKKIMKWPEDLIIGGVQRNRTGSVVSAEAFQSVFLVSGPQDVYQRFKDSTSDTKPNFDVSRWSPNRANDIIQAWQRNFTVKIYNHHFNNLKKNIRTVHPLASTSIQDMLTEFSQFNYTIIVAGYVIMVIYAAYTQLNWDGYWFAVESTSCLAIIGVILVTFSSIAGLGLSTLVGVHFNAATTQIVPFLTLGLGIDDMFLILHNYNLVIQYVKRNEMAVLLKETGMSITITSVNIILAFITGTILPIPALRSFCAQTAILLFFNMICTMVLFPGFISKDLERRKAGIRDMTLSCFRCCSPSTTKLQELEDESSQANLVKKELQVISPTAEFQQPLAASSVQVDKQEVAWYTLTGILHRWYIPALQQPLVKTSILAISAGMFIFGGFGLYNSKLGLELSDVLPKGTAPSAFLAAREKYFSFYPMYAVLQGPNVDYPNRQELIENLRKDIAKSKYVVTIDNGKPSEEYWMSLMRTWLISLQNELDSALDNNYISRENGTILVPLNTTTVAINDDALLARRLVCSVGHKYSCENRIGRVRLVDDADIINPEGFYNYLTAWFYVDNMMYYVSQAAFFPTPPAWGFNPKEDKLVPPADPLAYSQIPFYLTGLVDTPIIVDMIKEIRSKCEQYADFGLPTFPLGIAFTFWEQYLELTNHLIAAIVIIAGSVLLVIAIIIFNPWAAAMVAIVVVSMTVELGGFMGLFGVKLNPISAVTLITAVGIGVEFTAHVVLAFLTAMGTKNERMSSCLDHMFIPVIHGGLSTLLGLVMLAFTPFDFILKYFFYVMTVLVLIGLFNGIVMLPVMLSLFGPPCEVVPTDGSNHLACPPPLNKNKLLPVSIAPPDMKPGYRENNLNQMTPPPAFKDSSSEDEELSTISDAAERSDSESSTKKKFTKIHMGALNNSEKEQRF